MSINKAIQDNEFYLVYQPKMNLGTGEIAAVEALMRWEHPTLGNLPPFEFIPVAEQSGVMTDLGYWVIIEERGKSVGDGTESTLPEGAGVERQPSSTTPVTYTYQYLDKEPG